MNWIDRLSNNIGKKLSKQSGYDHEKEEILIYMVTRLFQNAIWLIILFFISSYLDILLPVFVSWISFVLLRRCFGGVHVDSSILCLLISIVMILLTGFLATLLDISLYNLMYLYVFNYVVVIRVGVVDNKNKVLKKSRKEKFMKQGMITMCVIFLANMLLQATGFIEISNAIILGILLNSISLLLSKVKVKRECA